MVCPQATGGPLDTTNPFVCAFGDQLHFAYVDTKGNIQDCWYDGPTGRWNLQQINNAGGNGPTVHGEAMACPQATASPLHTTSPRNLTTSAFVCAFGDQQHFAYVDGNLNIQDCWYDGPTGRWNLQQINNAGGNGPTVHGEAMACPQATAGPLETASPFVCAFGDQLHFAYVDTNGNIQDCYWTGGG
jgi:hypothetical protein